MKTVREQLVEQWSDEELLFLDPPEDFDYAIVGVAERLGMENVVVYDRDKILEQLCKELTPQEAVEYFDFNTAGAWVGETTPIFIKRYGSMEALEDALEI